MQTSKAKVFTGVLVFVGIIALGAVIFNFVRLYMSMPSKAEVMNFASDTFGDVPTVGEVIKGSLVPDGGEAPAGESGVATTLPDISESNEEASTAPAADWLTPGQRQVLATLGVDESALPTTLTPELEACFVAKLGEERVEAIKDGDTPTLIEGMKAISCL